MSQRIGTCYKTPSDTLKQTVDFSGDLPSGVTLSSAAASVVSGGGGLSVGAVPTNDTTTATLSITAGKLGQEYLVEVTGTYSDGQVRTFGVVVVVL
jgi:hypothetical protein